MKDSATSWAWRLVALSALVLLLGVLTGSQGLSTWSMLRDDPALADVVLNLRLPRTLGAWLAGALLGLAGAIAQGCFATHWPILICWAALLALPWAWPWCWA